MSLLPKSEKSVLVRVVVGGLLAAFGAVTITVGGITINSADTAPVRGVVFTVGMVLVASALFNTRRAVVLLGLACLTTFFVVSPAITNLTH